MSDHSLNPTATLASLRRGDTCIVLAVDDERARMHAIRFGIADGAEIACITRIPAGPIVVRSGRQEIAVGRELAKRIQVREVA
jgi:ferrous iron transport protein A